MRDVSKKRYLYIVKLAVSNVCFTPTGCGDTGPPCQAALVELALKSGHRTGTADASAATAYARSVHGICFALTSS